MPPNDVGKTGQDAPQAPVVQEVSAAPPPPLPSSEPPQPAKPRPIEITPRTQADSNVGADIKSILEGIKLPTRREEPTAQKQPARIYDTSLAPDEKRGQEK